MLALFTECSLSCLHSLSGWITHSSENYRISKDSQYNILLIGKMNFRLVFLKKVVKADGTSPFQGGKLCLPLYCLSIIIGSCCSDPWKKKMLSPALTQLLPHSFTFTGCKLGLIFQRNKFYFWLRPSWKLWYNVDLTASSFENEMISF